MTVIVPHHTTADKALAKVDQSANEFFSFGGASMIEITDQKKSWNGPTMNFSLSARVGFISLPVSGTVTVDAVNVTVVCDLPPLVNKFIGEDKVRAGVEQRVRGMLGPAA